MYASYKRSRVRFHNILSGPIPLAKHNFRFTLRLCKRTMRLDKKSATIKDFRLAMNQNLHLFINQLSLESITLSLGGVKPAEKPRKGRLFLSNEIAIAPLFRTINLTSSISVLLIRFRASRMVPRKSDACSSLIAILTGLLCKGRLLLSMRNNFTLV